MRDELYYGLRRIAERLGVGRGVARSLIDRKCIRAHKAGKGAKATWYCVESEINEDIKRLPESLCQ